MDVNPNYMETESDVIAGSSPAATDAGEVASDATADSSSATDVKSESSTEGVKSVDSPPTTQDEGLDEFKADVAKATKAEPARTEAEAKPEVTGATKTDEPAPDKGMDKDSEALSQEIEKSFAERPEWKAMAALKVDERSQKIIRQQLRTLFNRESVLTQAVERAKPAQEVVAEMFQSVGGSEQGFRNMRHLLKSFDADPAAAVPMLKTLLSDAEKRAGLVLQSPELLTEAQVLDEQVRAGVIDQGAADKRKKELLELEQVRTTQKRTQVQTEADRQRQQRAQSEFQTREAAEAINLAEANWTAGKLKNDPDFRAVQSLHGVFAQQNALDFFNEHKRMPNVKESEQLLEKSLKSAKDEAAKYRPKPKPRQAISGGANGSSGNNRQQPASEFDDFKATVEAAQQRHSR